MPILKQAKKRVRVDKRRHINNQRITSELNTVSRKTSALIEANKKEEAKAQFKVLTSKYGKAANKGVIHKSTASRRIARIAKSLAKLS